MLLILNNLLKRLVPVPDIGVGKAFDADPVEAAEGAEVEKEAGIKKELLERSWKGVVLRNPVAGVEIEYSVHVNHHLY